MRKSEEKGLREKASLFSGLAQRVTVVCFEMGAPYFKVRRGTWGPWGLSCLALGLGNEARETGSERMGFDSPLWLMDEKWAVVWMPVQQGKWRVPSRSSSQFLGEVQGRGPWEVGSWEEPAVHLPSWVSAPESKVGAEKKRASRQSGKKREFIRGKREGDWPSRRTSVLPFWQGLSYTPPMKNSL